MLNYDEIKNASAEELQSQMRFLQRDIQHAESWLRDLDYSEDILKAALSSKKKKTETVTALKKQLLKCGMSQKILARRLGISRAAVSLQIKTGIKKANVAAKYAQVMHCDPRSLLEF